MLFCFWVVTINYWLLNKCQYMNESPVLHRLQLYFFFLYIMELLSVLSWKRLLAVTIISQIVGMIWYGPLFSSLYMKEFGKTLADREQWMKDMPKSMLLEVLSRLVYFVGLGILLNYTAQLTVSTVGCLYFLAVVSTERSAVIWSDHSWRLWAMRAGKVLIDTVIALWLYNIL